MNLLASPGRRKLCFALLYFSEGAPIGFLWWVMPTLLRERGAPVEEIGALLSLLVLPWTLKFLWAPLIDVLRGPRWTLRAWIVSSQACMALFLLPLWWVDPGRSFGLFASLLVAHAVAASTQDAAIDALAVRTTAPRERGGLSAWMQAGMLGARALFGGFGLVLASRFGERALLALLAGVIAASTLLALAYRDETSQKPAEPRRALSAFRRALGGALLRRETWLGLAFAATAGAGFEALGGLAGPFLVDRGYESAAIGRFFGTASIGCMIAGGLAGGRLSDRGGRRRTVAGAAVFLAWSILCVAALASLTRFAGPAPLALLAVFYFGIGMFVASSYALFMDLTDPELGSTQFSAFMGATNLCEAWAVLAAGELAARLGYGGAFALLAIASLAALLLLPGMRPASPAERGDR